MAGIRVLCLNSLVQLLNNKNQSHVIVLDYYCIIFIFLICRKKNVKDNEKARKKQKTLP